MKQKGFAPILIIVVIAVGLLFIAGRIYAYGALISSVEKASPIYVDENAVKDWQSYTDTDLSISFKYPPGWFVTKSGSDSIDIHSFTPRDLGGDKENYKGKYSIVIDKGTRASSKSLKQLAEMKKMPSIMTMGGRYYYKNQKEFKVNNYTAFYVESTNKEHTTAYGETYLFDGKGAGVIFTASGDIEGSKAFLGNIMSTLQFIPKPYESSSVTKEKTDNDNVSRNDMVIMWSLVGSCRLEKVSRGVPTKTIHSTNADGCGNKEALAQYDPLKVKQISNSTVHILNNGSNTKICLYTENSSGNGIISWDSETGILTEPGKSNSTSSCD